MEKSARKLKISVFKLWVLSDFSIVGSGFSSDFTICQKTQGQFTCTLLMKDRKDTFNMEHGDVIRVPLGASIYLINNDNDEHLHIAKLIRSVNSFGRFEEFFPTGSGNPKSYFNISAMTLLNLPSIKELKSRSLDNKGANKGVKA